MADLQKTNAFAALARTHAERLVSGVHCRFGPGGAPPEEAHAKVAQLCALWRALMPGPGLLPGRQHFDPLAVPPLLDNLWLLEIVPEDARRFRLRLVGGALTRAGAGIRKGQFFTEVGAPEDAARACAMFADLERRREADWRKGPSILEYMEHVRVLERVILPMAADGIHVDMFLCLSLFYAADGTTI